MITDNQFAKWRFSLYKIDATGNKVEVSFESTDQADNSVTRPQAATGTITKISGTAELEAGATELTNFEVRRSFTITKGGTATFRLDSAQGQFSSPANLPVPSPQP